MCEHQLSYRHCSVFKEEYCVKAFTADRLSITDTKTSVWSRKKRDGRA